MSEEGKEKSSYDLISDDLVREALTNEFGPDVGLLKWTIKDFTKKGDNYASIVTSIKVSFKNSGKEECETSYVVKLNPMRPKNHFSKFLEDIFDREPVILSNVINGMSEELKKLNVDPIRAPKIYSYVLGERKQVFIAEDLCKQSFKMYDRRTGMNLDHALLIVKEMGRFHASSLLFEQTLPTQSISETFELSENMADDEPLIEMFNKVLGDQCKNACEMLRNLPVYESCVEWLKGVADKVGRLYLGSLKPSEKFDVLCHGDCWTNNFLFRYDDEGHPEDLRFLDLQMSRKSTPAWDLNYFFYSSLDGEGRKNNSKQLLIAYYLSFLKVLLLAGMTPPFSFEELEEEVMGRKVIGLFTGIMILPIILAEEEDEILDPNEFFKEDLDEYMARQKERFQKLSQREGPFKDRFLSLFDDMIQFNIFDS